VSVRDHVAALVDDERRTDRIAAAVAERRIARAAPGVDTRDDAVDARVQLAEARQ
jgi:hypothetical protein